MTAAKPKPEPKPEPDTMALWGKYFTPPADALKPFTRAGGFKGTAVEPMWAIRSATQEWGPMGDLWGLEVLEESFQVLGPSHTLHISSCRVYYPGPSGARAYVPCVGQTWVVSPGKSGPLFDEEAVKKSRTDALAKGLSWLGFGAGVHMGAFDGCKWASLPEFLNGGEPKPSTVEPKPPTRTDAGAAAKAREPANAAKVGNGHPESAVKLAANLWSKEADTIKLASGQDGEPAAKRFLLQVIEEAANRLGLDMTAPSEDDLKTWRGEVRSLIQDQAFEQANAGSPS